MPFKLCIISGLLFSLLLAACASDDEPKSNVNIVTSSSSTSSQNPEFNVIELYADLNTDKTTLEGIWESPCKLSPINRSYYKLRRAYHLNGIFKQTAIYDLQNCVKENFQNTLRLFGTMNTIESTIVSSVSEEIEIRYVTNTFLAASNTGRPIAIKDLTLDDLTPYSTEVDTFIIIGNRMYVTTVSNPDLIEIVDENNSYLINVAINTELSEAEMDQIANAYIEN